MILQVLKKAFSNGVQVPNSFLRGKSYGTVSFSYHKISHVQTTTSYIGKRVMKRKFFKHMKAQNGNGMSWADIKKTQKPRKL